MNFCSVSGIMLSTKETAGVCALIEFTLEWEQLDSEWAEEYIKWLKTVISALNKYNAVLEKGGLW